MFEDAQLLALVRLLFREKVRGEYTFDGQDHERRFTVVGGFYQHSVFIYFKVLCVIACQVYFRPDEVRACIVTCGGLCPGINTVIREIVCGLNYMYGVDDILGIQVTSLPRQSYFFACLIIPISSKDPY